MSLQKHPFGVNAFFERSVVLTFAVPALEAVPMIPECVEPDVWENKWAFVAVAMVQTRDLRPEGFPKWFGTDFFLIGYRVFVRYTTLAGKNLRGLFILGSQTDSKRMEWLGNFFTTYRYTTTDIVATRSGEHIRIASVQSGLQVDIKKGDAETPLPKDSPFTSWKEARRFAGPLPFTFSYDAASKEVLIVEGVREHWQPQPVSVSSFRIPWMDSLPVTEAHLASAFMVENIPYHWKKGRTETWSR